MVNKIKKTAAFKKPLYGTDVVEFLKTQIGKYVTLSMSTGGQHSGKLLYVDYKLAVLEFLFPVPVTVYNHTHKPQKKSQKKLKPILTAVSLGQLAGHLAFATVNLNYT